LAVAACSRLALQLHPFGGSLPAVAAEAILAVTGDYPLVTKELAVLPRTKVLITGAAGRIGSFLTQHLADRYEFVLADVVPPTDLHGHRFIEADIADLEAMRTVCHGIDTVVHLAADPNMEATWDSLLPRNIVGLYNVFQAAHEASCRRVIFASSVNAVFGYPAEVQVHTGMPVRPLNLYGATKCWGEAVACFYADQLDLSAICLRFGWVQSRDSELIGPNHPYLDILLTYHDLAKLVVASIEAPDDLRFGIFHGVSNNRWKRLDISDARERLGYEPEDDAFVLAGLAKR
jgi:nucleoside-diphosphate-sugar epimerase